MSMPVAVNARTEPCYAFILTYIIEGRREELSDQER